MAGTLYIVATPLGHLDDLTLRAIQILKEVDVIACEDTRRTVKLCHHLGIHKKLVSYFEYSSLGRTRSLLQTLAEGQSVALVSDAGTPGISDPGAKLVAYARNRNIDVVPIPGPSALMACVSVAGFPTEPLHFWGFLSPKPSKRKRVYEHILNLEGLHAFYESPYKILKHLQEWQGFFPEYYCFVAKEMTKQFETFWRGPLKEVWNQLKDQDMRGEFTVLLSRCLLNLEDFELKE